MPRSAPEVIAFRRNDPTPVVEVMRQVAPANGWLTLQPAIDLDDTPARGGTPGLFSGRGPMVPVCSWVPGERTRRGDDYVALGIEHATGPKAAERLAERGPPVPDRWAVLQDNPRRGLVVAVPPDDAPEDVLRWLLDAASALSQVPLTGEWQAFVYRRRKRR